MIYFDFNIFRHIIDKRGEYEYILSKTFKLLKQNYIFPYSPAHIEECALILKLKLDDTAKHSKIQQHLRMISLVSKNQELLPSKPLENYVDTYIHLKSEGVRVSEENEKNLIKSLNNNPISDNNKEYPTKLCIEHPSICFKRVTQDLDMTTYAEHNDVYNIGRNNEKSLIDNFSRIGKSITNDTITFEELRHQFNIDPISISNLNHVDIFVHDGVIEILKLTCKDYNIPYIAITKGEVLSQRHDIKEQVIPLLFDTLDKSKYYADRQNDYEKIRSRMHDVTHAIYGSAATFFVSDDERLRYRLKAVYHFLQIPTQVLSSKEFIIKDFKKNDICGNETQQSVENS